MIRDDERSPGGRRRIHTRTLPSRIHVEVLPEDDWEFIAAHELKRLALEVEGYHQQIDVPEVEDALSNAVSAIESARMIVNALKAQLNDA